MDHNCMQYKLKIEIYLENTSKKALFACN